MSKQDAIALLMAQVQADVYPTLDPTELEALLDGTQAFTVWKPSTAYHYDDVVQPTVPNGHRYRCIVAGTSGATEPFWPLYQAPDMRVAVTRPHWHGFQGPMPGSQVTDADTLVWLETGYDDGRQWNVRRATYNGWLHKAAKAAADYDVSDDRDRYSRSQVHDHCLAMAGRFRPSAIA